MSYHVESPCCSDPQSLTERNPKARRTSPLRLQGARVRAETLAPPFAEVECSAFWKGDGSRLAVRDLGLSPKSNRGFGLFVLTNVIWTALATTVHAVARCI